MVAWCWNGGDCHGHDPYLAPHIKHCIIAAHVLVYPIICYGFYVLSNRAQDLKRVGANFELLFYGFVALVVQTDFFIADHISSMWTATPETTTLDHIGMCVFAALLASHLDMFNCMLLQFVHRSLRQSVHAYAGYTVIVSSNSLLALGFAGYSIRSIFCCKKAQNPYTARAYDDEQLVVSRTNRSGICHSRIAAPISGLVALVFILITAIGYPRCKTLAVAMTMVSGIWCVNNLKLTLGKGILMYITVGIIAVSVGGVLTAVMNAICLQWLHIIIASSFGIQGLMITLSIKNFEIVGNEDNEKANYLTVNDSI